jgi:hypothetical protein
MTQRIRIEFELAPVAAPSGQLFAVRDALSGQIKCYATSPEDARAMVRALLIAAAIFEVSQNVDAPFIPAEEFERRASLTPRKLR